MVAFSKPREVDNNMQDIIKERKNRIELAQSCEDEMFKDNFKKMSLNDKQQILEKVSSYYNEVIGSTRELFAINVAIKHHVVQVYG